MWRGREFGAAAEGQQKAPARGRGEGDGESFQTALTVQPARPSVKQPTSGFPSPAEQPQASGKHEEAEQGHAAAFAIALMSAASEANPPLFGSSAQIRAAFCMALAGCFAP